MLSRFAARASAAGLVVCGTFAVAGAQELTPPTNPAIPGVSADDEQPAVPKVENPIPDEVAPAEPANPAPALDAESRDVQPNPGAQPEQPDANPTNAHQDARDAAEDARQDSRDDRRDDIRERADDRRDTRVDRRMDRRGADIGLTFGTAVSGALVIDQVGPRYFQDAGFRRGDRIVSADGRRFNAPADFYVWLGTVPVGQRVPIIVYRDGRETTVYWTPTAEFVDMYAQQSPGKAMPFLGIHVNAQVQNAVVVAQVDRNSPAERGGVTAGDMVISVNNQEVRSPREFADATATLIANQPVHMAISRTFDVQLDPAAPGPAEVRTSQPARPAPAVIEQPGRRFEVVPQSRYRDDYQRRGGLLRRGR